MAPREHLPRYFAKSGPTDADPRKTKKDGGGKGNWSAVQISDGCIVCVLTLLLQRGRSGEEMQDYGYSFANARRRSNSSTQGLADFRTKFETIDPEPVFEERIHGLPEATVEDESAVTKVHSTSSSSNDSETDHKGA